MIAAAKKAKHHIKMWVFRFRIRRICWLLVNHKDKVLYAEVRPMRTNSIKSTKELKKRLKDGTITCDCTEAITMIFRLAGAKDPNGSNYNGQGFTGTMLDHLPHFKKSISGAKTGAILIFGAGDGTHGCIVMSDAKGGNPWVFSNGSDAGPYRIRLSSEKTAHVGEPITLLGIQSLI